MCSHGNADNKYKASGNIQDAQAQDYAFPEGWSPLLQAIGEA
jgi:hypothetical protein